MSDFWKTFPTISVLALGHLADRPARPDSVTHAYFATDTGQLFFSDDSRDWVEISSSGGVTSVGLVLGSMLNLAAEVSGSPITGAGDIELEFRSQSANQVLASPDGSSGLPQFRALVDADIPNTLSGKTLTTPVIADFTSAQHDHESADQGGSLNAAAITSGVFSSARLPTDVVYETAAQTLSSKTLTSPRTNELLDTNGNEALVLPAAASAVNHLSAENAATGQAVTLRAAGDDANVGLVVRGKGTGTVQLEGGVVVNESGADADMRVEGDTNANLLVVDASADAVGIGTAAPNSATILDVSSTTRASRPVPSMTTAQRDAISSPPAGAMVYNTSAEEVQYYDGTNWKPLGGTAAVPKIAILDHRQNQGVNGGNIVGSSWQTSPLNHEYSDEDGIVSLSSNRFTPVAGDYEVNITAVYILAASSRIRCRIRNITAGTTQFTSIQAGFGGSSGPVSIVETFLMSCNGTDQYELQYYATANNTNGLGANLNVSGEPERYQRVVLKKIG
jgi:hypothetical protein